jgi:hypothetical protein
MAHKSCCSSCYWNYQCGNEKRKRCGDYDPLDEDYFIKELIKINRQTYHEEYAEYIKEWEQE